MSSPRLRIDDGVHARLDNTLKLGCSRVQRRLTRHQRRGADNGRNGDEHTQQHPGERAGFRFAAEKSPPRHGWRDLRPQYREAMHNDLLHAQFVRPNLRDTASAAECLG